MKYVFRLACILITACFLMQLPLSAWSKKTRPPTSSDVEASIRPDLVISKITYSPGPLPKWNDEVTITVRVKNVGQGGADASDVRVKVGSEGNPPVVQISTLNPGQERMYTRKFTFGTGGNFMVTATADYGNNLVESNEGNNVKQKTIQVRPRPKPDLVISKINYSPGMPKVGDEVTIWVFVKNVGQGGADASGVRFKVGGEGNPPVKQVSALNPSQERMYTRKFTYDSPINIVVTATADDGNDVVESNEGNNVEQKTIQVRPRPKPDLVVTKINYSPGSPKQHEQVKVWIFVKNIGPGKSDPCYLSEGDTLNYTLNSDSDPGWKWTNKHSVPALDPGREYRCDGLFLSNSSGTYYLKCFIDREDIIVETNEENNRLERKIVVKPASN